MMMKVDENSKIGPFADPTSHSHGSVSVVRTTFKVYGKMQTLTLSQPKTPEPILTKF